MVSYPQSGCVPLESISTINAMHTSELLNIPEGDTALFSIDTGILPGITRRFIALFFDYVLRSSNEITYGVSRISFSHVMLMAFAISFLNISY